MKSFAIALLISAVHNEMPTLDTKAIERGLGRSGRGAGGGVFQVSVPRAENITENGVPLLPAMGVVTVLNL